MRIVTAICVTILQASLMASAFAAGTRPVQGAIEARRLHIDVGPPARVRASPCAGCPSRTFLLAPDVELFADGERVSSDELGKRNGEIGTVIYDLESERAVRLRW